MKDQWSERQRLRGQVKWFDPGKGFGFILSEDGGPDILLHANVLRNFGQNSVSDGAGISVEVLETERGMQATEVLEIVPPDPQPIPLGEEEGEMTPEELLELALEPARVKWFDKVKGFGFANAFGKAEDIFIHIEVLRRSGFSDLQPGEALCLRVAEGSRGKMAVQAAPWDAALRETG